eukprot:m.46981 g.46981  ORF g.46981 m.46981 type:complete len:137 (+) comp33755_c0_seq4:2610-3020(+)
MAQTYAAYNPATPPAIDQRRPASAAGQFFGDYSSAISAHGTIRATTLSSDSPVPSPGILREYGVGMPIFGPPTPASPVTPHALSVFPPPSPVQATPTLSLEQQSVVSTSAQVGYLASGWLHYSISSVDSVYVELLI